LGVDIEYGREIEGDAAGAEFAAIDSAMRLVSSSEPSSPRRLMGGQTVQGARSL
jgi:hypothetical protein